MIIWVDFNKIYIKIHENEKNYRKIKENWIFPKISSSLQLAYYVQFSSYKNSKFNSIDMKKTYSLQFIFFFCLFTHRCNKEGTEKKRKKRKIKKKAGENLGDYYWLHLCVYISFWLVFCVSSFHGIHLTFPLFSFLLSFSSLSISFEFV